LSRRGGFEIDSWRKKVKKFLIALFMAVASSASVATEAWPAKAVHIIVPFPPGSSPDLIARMLTDKLAQALGQPVIVENRPGAGGNLGTGLVAKAAPDGYTLGLSIPGPLAVNTVLYKKMEYDPFKDLAPITLVALSPNVLVVDPELGVNSVKEFIDYVKARPGQLNYGSPGVGTGGHLVTELMVKRTGIEAVHVPYQATTQQMLAAAAGTLQFTFDTVGNARGMVDAGKVVPLAVTGARRATAAPDVPTFKELGYQGFDDLFVANGLLAPTGTSPAMIKALNREMVRMNASGPIREKLLLASYEPGTMSPEEYGAMIDRELKLWGDVVQETGVRIKA
jgi:tripartite-type tricarboxylate transporter receptor subunit TctC